MMTIDFKGNKFYCNTCGNQVTIKSEDHGKGFSARCKTCQKTLYYPECNDCGQALWKHNEEQHKVIVARRGGKQFCRRCKTEKPKEEFNMNGKVLASRCKTCQSEYFAEWYNRKTGATSMKVNTEEVLDELFAGELK